MIDKIYKTHGAHSQGKSIVYYQWLTIEQQVHTKCDHLLPGEEEIDVEKQVTLSGSTGTIYCDFQCNFILLTFFLAYSVNYKSVLNVLSTHWQEINVFSLFMTYQVRSILITDMNRWDSGYGIMKNSNLFQVYGKKKEIFDRLVSLFHMY